MTTTVQAVFENGVLRPIHPVPFREGQSLRFEVSYEAVEERAARAERFLRALRSCQEEAAQLPAEWWEQFDRELEESRSLVPERLELSDEAR